MQLNYEILRIQSQHTDPPQSCFPCDSTATSNSWDTKSGITSEFGIQPSNFFPLVKVLCVLINEHGVFLSRSLRLQFQQRLILSQVHYIILHLLTKEIHVLTVYLELNG